MQRATLKHPAILEGLGLFSAKPARASIHPAPANSGIRVSRTDVPGVRDVPARVDHISNQARHASMPPGLPGRNSSLAAAPDAEFGIATIEHLMSALGALNVWDAHIELDGPEIPILDGSSDAFVRAIRTAGLELAAESPRRQLNAFIEVTDKSGAAIRATPRRDGRCTFAYHLDYGPTSPIPRQSATFDPDRDDYAHGIAPARTFCLESEANAMHALGLFQHLTPRDMLVIGPTGKPIDNAFRFDNEPARHKLLDLIGDVALLGFPLAADITATRSGHALTHQLVREIQRAGL